MTEPALSIVVVSWNVRDLLRDCLRSLEETVELPAGSWEVIVVDNASSDGSREMVEREFPTVQVVANDDNRGFGAANNQAFERARGRHLLLLNPDTVVLGDAVATMLRHMDRHPDTGILGCRLLNTDGSYQRWTAGALPTLLRVSGHAFFLDLALGRFLPWRPMYLNRDVQGDLEVDWVTGACLLARREALAGALFDPTFFMYGEDTHLCARVRRAGWKVVYTASATVIHHHGKSMAKQSGEMSLNPFKGPRTFFAQRHGPLAVWLHDLVILAGFVLRAACYGALAVLRPGRGYRGRAAGARSYASRAWKVLLDRPTVTRGSNPPAAVPRLEGEIG